MRGVPKMSSVVMCTVSIVEHTDVPQSESWADNSNEFQYFLEKAMEELMEMADTPTEVARAFTVSVLGRSGYIPVEEVEDWGKPTERRITASEWLEKAKDVVTSMAFWKEWKANFQIYKRETDFINSLGNHKR